MSKTTFLSRRELILALVVAPATLPVAANSVETSSLDVKLLALGRQFDAISAEIDHAIDHGSHMSWKTLEQLDRVDREIVTIQAKTIEGLRVKARAACWGRLGDVDPPDEGTTDERMGLSIIRDLIRLYDPGLERPNALKELVEEIQNSCECNGVPHSSREPLQPAPSIVI